MKYLKPEVEAAPLTYAFDQPEYQALQAVHVMHPGYGVDRNTGAHFNTVLIRMQPTQEELAKLNNGESIYLHLLTFGRPLTPHIVSVGTDELESWYGVKVTK